MAAYCVQYVAIIPKSSITKCEIKINIATLAKCRLYLPDDGLCKPKHVGAIFTVF